MRGCGCLFALLSLAAMGVIVFLVLQPINEPPPTITAEGAARLDQKLNLLANPAAASDMAVTEEEINSKLAQSLAGLAAQSPLRSLFLRFRPDNRMLAIGQAELFGRTVGGKATLHLTPGADGKTTDIQWEAAQLGALPLPVSFFAGIAGPWIERGGLTALTPTGGAAQLGVMRTEGATLIISGKR